MSILEGCLIFSPLIVLIITFTTLIIIDIIDNKHRDKILNDLLNKKE